MANTVDFFEIGTANPAAVQMFYSNLFGWTMQDHPESSYTGIETANAGRGGIWDTSEQQNNGSWAIFYVHVDDVKASIAEAEKLGATVVVPYTDNGGIEFAHLEDPDGHRFGVWKPKT